MNFAQGMSLSILCIWFNGATAGTVLDLVGTIGDRPVIMELDVDEQATVEGRYFFRDAHCDIPVYGSRISDGAVRLADYQPQYDHVRFEMVLKPNVGGGWQGDWVDISHPESPQHVVLAQITPADLPPSNSFLDGLNVKSPYEYLRLVNLPLDHGRVERLSGRTLKWWTEPVTGISVFRVADGYPSSVLSRVNHDLASIQLRAIIGYFECRRMYAINYGTAEEESEFAVRVVPRLMNNKVFSASVEIDQLCGGHYVDLRESAVNIDGRSGDIMTLEDVFWLGRGTPVIGHDEGGNPLADSYRERVLAPWLAKVMNRRYSKRIGEGSTCNFNREEIWRFPQWYLTNKGLYLGPKFAREEEQGPCGGHDWWVLPWDIVNKYPGAMKLDLPGQ